MNKNITYVPNREINKQKWDECLNRSDNGLIYAHSFFLDNIAPGWDALVLGDYVAIMPLTWKKKYGFYYLFQPFFTAALGIFGNSLSNEVIFGFLEAIPHKFKYWDIDLNEENKIKSNKYHYIFSDRVNYFLHLDKSAEEIQNNFKRLAFRKILKAKDHGLSVVISFNPSEAIDFYKQSYKSKHPIPEIAFTNLLKAVNEPQCLGKARVYLAKQPDGETIAAYLILIDNRFVYSVLGGSIEKGKETGAFYMLTAAAICDSASSNRTFRFEGSDDRGIAFFNEQFGPKQITYSHLRSNKLPFPFNLFKK